MGLICLIIFRVFTAKWIHQVELNLSMHVHIIMHCFMLYINSMKKNKMLIIVKEREYETKQI